MEPLFHIETERVSLSWRARATNIEAKSGGLLRIKAQRAGLVFDAKTRRQGVPEQVASDWEILAGPRLFEQTDYSLYAQAKQPTQRVEIRHVDPNIKDQFKTEDYGRIAHGVLNFGAQIGRSEFLVVIDGEPEFAFELEVFPSKLDYAEDYNQILADVQSILTGLALEYLRSTYQFGSRIRGTRPTELEWVLLLQHVLDDLEKALHHVAQQPVRRVVRETESVRCERVKRVDSGVRRAIQRGAGSGRLVRLDDGTPIREWLPEKRAQLSLDTPEHRWLSLQLGRIQRRVAALRAATVLQTTTRRRQVAVQNLERMEARLARLSSLEPMVAADGEPPPGFASLQLLNAPGYKEAYQACVVLALGLRVEDGPLRLSVKEISTLYEYWCYLATLRFLAETSGHSADLRDLFCIRSAGLQVDLWKGRQSTVRIAGNGDRKITVRYNPSIDSRYVLVPQRPDVLISIADPDWPQVDLVLDAKYRVDTSPEYILRYRSPGPPDDALNVLHRYRDAIVAARSDAPQSARRTVVQAVAAFPHSESEGEDFSTSRLWQSLKGIGIGAVPLLPGTTKYLEAWLVSNLNRGAWELADQALGHASHERASDWRKAATEVVFVGTLRGDNPAQHLDWIRAHRQYYAPLSKTQRRQFVARWVAIYSPQVLRPRGAITHIARVAAVQVVGRSEISTPWRYSRDPSEGNRPG
jgi:predicted component of viral defense system (DUF524 family)